MRKQSEGRPGRGGSVPILLLLGGLVACSGTPDSVKTLSAAQVKNVEAYCSDVARSNAALAQYFERYAEEKQKVFEQRHAANKADAVKLVAADAKEKSWDATKTASEVASVVSSLELQHAKDKADLNASVTSLVEALSGSTARCKKLVTSQAKIDEYVKLEKADDVGNRLVAEKLGVDTDALRKQVDALANKVPKL